MSTRKTVTVRVTREDINRGIVASANSCPIARALRRTLHARTVYVYDSSFTVRGATYGLPVKAANFVARFDSSDTVDENGVRAKKATAPSPFTFRVPVAAIE
jgi:hypothetical protein